MMENMKCEICYQDATGIHYGAKTCDKCKVSSLSLAEPTTTMYP